MSDTISFAELNGTDRKVLEMSDRIASVIVKCDIVGAPIEPGLDFYECCGEVDEIFVVDGSVMDHEGEHATRSFRRSRSRSTIALLCSKPCVVLCSRAPAMVSSDTCTEGDYETWKICPADVSPFAGWIPVGSAGVVHSFRFYKSFSDLFPLMSGATGEVIGVASMPSQSCWPLSTIENGFYTGLSESNATLEIVVFRGSVTFRRNQFNVATMKCFSWTLITGQVARNSVAYAAQEGCEFLYKAGRCRSKH